MNYDCLRVTCCDFKRNISTYFLNVYITDSEISRAKLLKQPIGYYYKKTASTLTLNQSNK